MFLGCHVSDLSVVQNLNERVAEAEADLLALPQVHIHTTSIIHGGMCARTIFIPGGVDLTGALTKIDNFCIIHGDIEVTTDQGPIRYTGFNVIPAKGGLKRGGRTYADTYWTMVWPTQLTDIVAIEDEMTDEGNKLKSRQALGWEHAILHIGV